jgi:hypothetical protein
MLSSKVIVRLIATAMLPALAFVLYPGGSANAAHFCAELQGATAMRVARTLGRLPKLGGGHCYKLRHKAVFVALLLIVQSKARPPAVDRWLCSLGSV